MKQTMKQNKSVVVLKDDVEASIDELAQEAYRLRDRAFTPLYPWVFVRQLPKEQVRNGVILPAIEQNKTVEEGIVLAVWRPVDFITQVRSSDNKVTKAVEKRSSSLQVGQHVLYPHWAGMPIEGFSEKRYRVVREEDWSESANGGIIAVVEQEEALQLKLRDVINDATEEDWDAISLGAAIRERFQLIDRKKSSVTLSGR